MISGSAAALPAGLRFAAASQTRERSSRECVSKPYAKSSGFAAVRSKNRETVGFEGSGPMRPGEARSMSKSATCSPPAASIAASEPRTLPESAAHPRGRTGQPVLAKPTETERVHKAWEDAEPGVGDQRLAGKVTGTDGKSRVRLDTGRVLLHCAE